jgi:hypothetical protein
VNANVVSSYQITPTIDAVVSCATQSMYSQASHRVAIVKYIGSTTNNCMCIMMLYDVILHRYEETLRRAEGLTNGHF